MKRVKGNDNPGSLNQMYEELYNIKNKNFTDKDLFNFNYIEIIINEFPNAKFVNCKENQRKLLCQFLKIGWRQYLGHIH